MNILIISPFFPPSVGGIETHLEDLCRYLQKKNHRVFVITYQPLTTKRKGQNSERKGNLEIHRIQWCGHGFLNKLEGHPILQILYLDPPLLLFTLFFVLRHSKEIDVFHAHALSSALVVKVLAYIFKKRTVCSLHGIVTTPIALMNLLMKKSASLILSSFDVVLTLSEASKQHLLSMGLSNDKVRVYHHWVDQNFFRPLSKDNCRKLLNISDEFTVLFVGRLLASKGVLHLINAVISSKCNIICLIAGDGPLAPRIAQIASVYRNVRFVGKVSKDFLVKLYNAADVVAAPSLYKGEEGLRVVIEALSCGTPVIASNEGNLPELLDESVGILIEPTVINIMKALENLCRNRDYLKSLASNARNYACREFSEKNAELIEKSYSW